MKILFYAINGKGMGHLARTRIIAGAIKRAAPDSDIRFLTCTPHLSLLNDFDYPSIRFPNSSPPKNLILFRTGKTVSESEFLDKTVKFWQPAAVIYDFLLDPKLFGRVRKNHCKNIVVLRKQRKSRVKRTLTGKAVDKVDKWIIPHERQEFSEIQDYINERNCIYTGPLFREMDMEIISGFKQCFVPGDKHIIVTIGGGGAMEAQKWLIEVMHAVEEIVGVDNSLRFTVVCGPYFSGNLPQIKGASNVKVITYCNHLPELICASDLVLANAGYNTINEIRASGTKAMIYPLSSTGWDDQSARARSLIDEHRYWLCPAGRKEISKKIELFA